MVILKWVVLVLLGLVLALIGGARAGLFEGSMPTDLGVISGKLKPPSASDNSVSSQAVLFPEHPRHLAAQIPPLALRGEGPATIAKISAVVQAMPGAKIVKSDANYLYAQFTTPLMRFVDDVEFWYDPAAQLIQVRSASRVGESDLGVNRKRIETVRAALGGAP